MAILVGRATTDPVLKSIFSRHVYIGQLDLAGVKSCLQSHGLPDDHAAFLAFWSRGRWKQMLMTVPKLTGTDASVGVPEAYRKEMARLAGNWGATKATKLDPSAGIKSAIDAAVDVEELVGAIAASALPLTRATDFGLDALRSLLACAAVELMNPVLIADPAERQEWIEKFPSRFPLIVGPSILRQALNRLAKLIEPVVSYVPPPPNKTPNFNRRRNLAAEAGEGEGL